MDEQIDHITISNFKSIKNCTINGCKQINLFIGRPNVGKSNILEALSLFTIPYLRFKKSKNLNNLVRVENVTELFYSGNYEQTAYVETNREAANLLLDGNSGLDITFLYKDKATPEHYYFDDNLNLGYNGKRSFLPTIKKYTYNSQHEVNKALDNTLLPPYGHNLYHVLERRPDLKKEIGDLFKEYQLELVFDRGKQIIEDTKAKCRFHFFNPL